MYACVCVYLHFSFFQRLVKDMILDSVRVLTSANERGEGRVAGRARV